MKKIKYRADIDGLRAIAVLSVVGFHAFPRWFKGGYVGVDIFFVISGFLISTIILKGLKENTFSFIEFYERRIRRIFPALVLVLIFCMTLGWFTLFSDEYKQLGRYTLGSSVFISNFLLWQDNGYFDTAASTKPLLHLWSLGIEEQFYLIWPLLLWIVWKKQFNLYAWIVIIGLVSFIFNCVGIIFYPTATFYLPITRFWELLCGSLLSYGMLFRINILEQTKKESRFWFSNKEFEKNILSFLGLLIISGCVFLYTKELAFPGIWALPPVLGAVFMIKAGEDSWINRVLLSNKILVWFGLISYPLYLWHWPLLSFAQILEEGMPNFDIRIFIVVLSIILAWLTYNFIEKPIRHQEFEKTVPTLVLSMLFIACMGGSLQWFKGYEFRIRNVNSDLIALISHPRKSPKEQFDCSDLIPAFKKLNFNGLCSLSKKSDPDIMFIGDSHAWQYQSAVWEQFKSNSVLMVVEVSCLPFASNNFMKGDCKNKYDTIISFLEKNNSIKKVYLSGYWAYLMSGGFVKEQLNWRQPKPLSADAKTTFLANGQNFLSKIIKTNKELVFFRDIPDLDFNINTCFKLRPFSLHKLNKECSMSYAQYKNRIFAYDEVINELLAPYPQIKIYNPRPLFCQADRCIARDDSLPYYFNGDHLNSRGVDMVIKDALQKV